MKSTDEVAARSPFARLPLPAHRVSPAVHRSRRAREREVPHDAIQGEFLCGNQSAFRSVARAIESAYDEQRDTLTEHHQSVIDRIATEGLRG